jgi:cytochrome c biogenesis protein CcdA
MQQWIQQILSADHAGIAFFPAVFLLGMLGSVSSCCALPAIGAVVGYAGSRETQNSRRELWLVGLFFMIGTTIALAAIGAVSGFVGQFAGSSLGKYWQFVSGLVIVLFGLVSLDFVHFRIPKMTLSSTALGSGIFSAMLYGLVLGGASTACSVGCNPLLPIAIGATMINGSILMSMLIFTVFALGYSLPLAAGLIGIGFGLGRLGNVAQRVMPVVRIFAGVLLIGVGFYLLVTI